MSSDSDRTYDRLHGADGHTQANPIGPDGFTSLAPIHIYTRAEVESECPSLCGEHHWLWRPESDSRECLICGTEVFG